MLRSMTGYGRGEATIGGRRIVFEIKSVNHKFFEFNSRITRGYLFLEDKLKAYVQGKISRGKVDVFLQIETLEETDVQVLVNHSLASAYVKALEELQQRYQLPDGPSLALLSKYSDIFSVHKAPEDEDAVWEAVRQVADMAIASFLKMREAEGARLKADILEKAGEVIALVDQVEQALQDCSKSITVAVMGCVVNGPGEAREADVGIAGGEDCGVLFVKGEPVRKLPYGQLLPALLDQIQRL